MPEKSPIFNKTSRLYIGKSTVFKLFLLFGVALISTIFVWYTFSVIDQLKEDTRSQVEKYVKMWQLAANSPSSGEELQFIFDEIIVKATFPIIVLNQDMRPIHWRNIKGIDPADTTAATRSYLSGVAKEMISDHRKFSLYFGENFENYLCYGDSAVVRQLKMMPFIEIGILLAFLILASIGFQNIRQSEERHIWVGMAKETAHQLGTPITSLLGWLEVMQAEELPGERTKSYTVEHETIDNMLVDVSRLQRVANRFSMIGSVPELTSCDLNQLVSESIEYYKRRLPFEGKGLRLTFEPGDLPETRINPELLGWVFENLIKNALQTVDSKTGVVTIRTASDMKARTAVVSIIDNGKGITQAAARKIFRAGFTTKSRGWGLGLTLVKRIVEEYHGGRIHLKRSRPGETVFEMILPIGTKKQD